MKKKVKSYSEQKAERRDRMETVAEELTLMGFPSTVDEDGYIIIQTVAGDLKRDSSESSVMADVYRLIGHIGHKLAKWGLHNKIEENKKNRGIIT